MLQTRSWCRFYIFEVEELENKERNDVPLARDLASDCDVTISVTAFVFRLIQMLQIQSWCLFYYIQGRGTRKYGLLSLVEMLIISF